MDLVEVQSFAQRVPGGADRASDFLSAVLQAAQAEGVPAELKLNKQRKGRMVLQANKIRFGGFMSKSRPMRLEVYADPVGKNLNVGWQLSALTLTGMMANAGANPAMEAKKDRKDNSPQVRRELESFLAAFHEGAFLPTLIELADSLGPSQTGAQRQGFFGA